MFSTNVFVTVAVLATLAALCNCNVIGGSVNTDFTTDDGIRSLLSRSKLFVRLASKLEMMAPRPADNPFLRNKRAADCPVPSDLPQRVLDLNPYLNATQFVGLIKQDTSDYKPLPKDQPNKKDCPAATGSWWPRPEFNLRSTCPWILEERDLGEEYFPR